MSLDTCVSVVKHSWKPKPFVCPCRCQSAGERQQDLLTKTCENRHLWKEFAKRSLTVCLRGHCGNVDWSLLTCKQCHSLAILHPVIKDPVSCGQMQYDVTLNRWFISKKWSWTIRKTQSKKRKMIFNMLKNEHSECKEYIYFIHLNIVRSYWEEIVIGHKVFYRQL